MNRQESFLPLRARLQQLKASVNTEPQPKPAAASRNPSEALHAAVALAWQSHATEDHTSYTPMAGTTRTAGPRGLADAGRMLTFILNHHLLMGAARQVL